MNNQRIDYSWLGVDRSKLSYLNYLDYLFNLTNH